MRKLETIYQMTNTASVGGYVSFDRGVGKVYGPVGTQNEVVVFRVKNGPPLIVKIGRDDHSANERIGE